MSNKRDRRRKGVIYPGQSGTGRSQNTFFTETGKEPFVCRERGIIMNVFETIKPRRSVRTFDGTALRPEDASCSAC